MILLVNDLKLTTLKTYALLGFNIQPLARTARSYVNYTNDFVRKLKGLNNLPECATLKLKLMKLGIAKYSC